MADESTPQNPDAETPGAAESTGAAAPESSEQSPGADSGAEQTGGEQAPAQQGEHAVPGEEAQEIAAVAEDAPLEAIQEAQQRGGAGNSPEAGAFEPIPGSAVPSADAQEIAGVAEDAPLEAVQEAREAQVEEELEEVEKQAPREKPAVPGAHLEVDIVPEGADPLGRSGDSDPYEIVAAVYEDSDGVAQSGEGDGEAGEETLSQPISTAAIDLASGARYRATGKRKTAIARVTLRPGSGTYLVNGRALEEHFPRVTLQRNIRQPLETVGYQERMDVVARLHGGGISAQAGALRHGVSRALLEADPNLRGELKRRGFLTRDSRAKERKKAGLKKARKRPQFSKR